MTAVLGTDQTNGTKLHLPTNERRHVLIVPLKKHLRSLARLIVRGGCCLVQSWHSTNARTHRDENDFSSRYLLHLWAIPVYHKCFLWETFVVQPKRDRLWLPRFSSDLSPWTLGCCCLGLDQGKLENVCTRASIARSSIILLASSIDIQRLLFLIECHRATLFHCSTPALCMLSFQHRSIENTLAHRCTTTPCP